MTPNTQTTELKATEDAGQMTAPTSSRFWQHQLEFAEKDHEEFWKYGEKVEKRYKNERDHGQTKLSRGKRLNIFYSNSETLKASLYARTAKPDVRQRFTQQRDQLSKTCGEMIERSLSYCSDNTDHERAFQKGVHDLVVPGRGVVRLEYEPKISMDPETGAEVIVDQKVREEFVYYKDFLHSPARCWGQVWWVAFRHRMTRDDLEEAGFDGADEIPLNWAPEIDGRKDREVPEELKRAEVWEVWHKAKKQRIWVVKGYPNVLRVDDDPYALENFWPMAEPVQAIVGNDSFVPRAELQEYEDQADDLDEITERISKLTKALKRRGVYNASVKELKRLAKAGDNEFIPSDNFAEFAAGGGLKGSFQTEDLKPIADALLGLYQQRDQLIQSIYEVTGISDIMRGSSDAGETATAQSIKAQFGSARLRLRQKDVQRWIRDTTRIKAELIAEHFEPQVLMQMSGMQLPSRAEVEQQMMQAQMQAMQTGQPPPQPAEPPLTIDDVMQVLRSDHLRGYQIDIETDSTVLEDAEAEKAGRTELLSSIAGFMQQWLPVVQAGGPPMMKLGFEMLSFGVRGYRQGRQLEDAIEDARMQIEQAAANSEPPPDPKLEGEKIKLEGVKMKAQADAQKTQMDMQKTMAEHQMDMERLQFEALNPTGMINGHQAGNRPIN